MVVWANNFGDPTRTVLAVTIILWFNFPPFTNKETVLISKMAEELQLETQSRIDAMDWSSLGRIAKFLKVEPKDKLKFAVAKYAVQRLEEELGKSKKEEIVPYLKDVKKLLTEKPFSGIKGEGKGENVFCLFSTKIVLKFFQKLF